MGASSTPSSSSTATVSTAIVRVVQGRRGVLERPQPRLSTAIASYPASRRPFTTGAQRRPLAPRPITSRTGGRAFGCESRDAAQSPPGEKVSK